MKKKTTNKSRKRNTEQVKFRKTEHLKLYKNFKRDQMAAHPEMPVFESLAEGQPGLIYVDEIVIYYSYN
jgi:hypothetical protein